MEQQVKLGGLGLRFIYQPCVQPVVWHWIRSVCRKSFGQSLRYERSWNPSMDHIAAIRGVHCYYWDARWMPRAEPAVDTETAKLTELAWWSTLDSLQGVSGLYSFWSASGECLYVGKSRNLGNRIGASWLERASQSPDLRWLKFFRTVTAYDATVLELVAIGLLCPSLNSKHADNDGLTLKIDLPSWSEGIICPKLKGKSKLIWN